MYRDSKASHAKVPPDPYNDQRSTKVGNQAKPPVHTTPHAARNYRPLTHKIVARGWALPRGKAPSALSRTF